MFVTQVLPLILFSLGLAVVGQVLLKIGMGQVRDVLPAGAGAVTLLTKAATNWMVIVGLVGYVISAASWLLVLAKADLSQVYPFAGLTVITVALASWLILKEPMTPGRWIGTLIVFIGVTMVARG
jgi:uncharacterized membrane protein